MNVRACCLASALHSQNDSRISKSGLRDPTYGCLLNHFSKKKKCLAVCTVGWTGRWMGGWMDGWMGEWMNGWMHARVLLRLFLKFLCELISTDLFA